MSIQAKKRSNPSLNNSLGNLLELTSTGGCIKGETDNGRFNIYLYSQSVIRIHIYKGEKPDEHSYATIANPLKNKLSLQEDKEKLVLSTNRIKLVIDKKPVRFRFYNLDDILINADDPAFGTSWIGEQVTTYKVLQEGEKFIGLGEKTGPLNRAGKGYQNWNTDSFAYGPGTDPLYCTMPFYIGIHGSVSYGLFFDNSFKSHFNFGASNNRFTSFSADSGDMNYYFIHDDSVTGILSGYAFLTGLMPLPPLWSIGYQQCRYSYYPDKEVYTLANTFRDKNIPADAIVLDIHYMDKYKIFTWDRKHFPHPEKMIKKLSKQGFQLVVMCDPGIKEEKGYKPYDEGMEQEVFIKYPDGQPYTGEVWPGWCHFPDFTNPDTREWWKNNLRFYVDQGVVGFWNDMNEIATWGQYLPELMELDFEGEKSSMRKGRNIYGMLMARSTYEGAKNLMKGKRPFNLTRSGFSGVQRYATVWTGDNVANDEHMMLGVRLVNSLGLTGVAFAGYDVGGFVGTSSEHLFARWMQIGTFSPFCRAHSMINSRDAEPWSFGEEVEEICRNYIKLRYKLMMYIYSSFYESSVTGIPVARSLAINYTFDEEVYDTHYQHQYLFGPSILVAPVESYKEFTRVWLPGEEPWYNFFTDEKIESGNRVWPTPIDELPLFVRGSSVIPVCPHVGKNTKELGDIIEYHVYAGNSTVTYTYFEDDGETYDFEKGHFCKREINYDPRERKIRISTAGGDHQSRFKKAFVCLHGFSETIFQVGDTSLKASKSDYLFIDPVSNFDPFMKHTEPRLIIKGLKRLSINNELPEILISW